MIRDRRPPGPLPELRADVARFLGYYNNLPDPPHQELGAEAARLMMRQARDLTDPPVGVLAVDRRFTIPGLGGPLPVRLFDAAPARPHGPIVLFFHGGGFVMGDINTHAPLAAEIARQLDLPVLSVGYRLAPEHPRPAAPQDCEAAARWLAAEGMATGLVVMGDSAGGTLATVTAMSLRDRPAAAPVIAQGLLYPATDMGRAHPSLRDFADGYFLTRAMLDWFVACYAADLGDLRAAPMRGDLAAMPPPSSSPPNAIRSAIRDAPMPPRSPVPAFPFISGRRGVRSTALPPCARQSPPGRKTWPHSCLLCAR